MRETLLQLRLHTVEGKCSSSLIQHPAPISYSG